MSEGSEQTTDDDVDNLTLEQLEAAIEASIQQGGAGALRLALTQAETFTPLDLQLASLPRNDHGNAERLLKRFPDQVLYVKGVGWYGWKGTHWSSEWGEPVAKETAAATYRSIFVEAKALASAGKWPGEGQSEFDRRVGHHLAWAAVSGNANKIDGMLKLLQFKVMHLPDVLDADPLLFNCSNCTLDLSDPSNVRKRKHNPDDKITRISPVRYDPNARCALFDSFIQRILPDISVRQFVQRWAGYMLTGDTSEQVVSLWWGEGANGKSTLAEALKFVLADYSKSIGFSSLIRDDRRRGADASPDLARLRGARAAFASEPENRVKFSEGLLKSMTGGEPLMVRHLHHEFFEYRPQFKLTLAFNNPPKVEGTDHGIWRRMALTPFGVIIPEEERDKDLVEKLRGEASGILNWMLDGYRSWRDRGLAIPNEVRMATEEYRADSDPIGMFLADAVEAGEPADRVKAGVLFAAYRRWCRENAQTEFTPTYFGRRVGSRFKRNHSGGSIYRGLRLKAEWMPRAADEPPPHSNDGFD